MINVNQITSQLAKMPDMMLQKFAAMHKTDPYTVSLALAESNRRKEMRASSAPQVGIQPKVVDQEVSQMAAPQTLPEETGIGQLPAQNLQSFAGGGIVAFDEGGEVPRYQNKGTTEGSDGPEQYRAYALKKAEAMGLDPIWVDRIFSHESKTKRSPMGYDPEAVSPTGATGIGQLVKQTASHYMRKVGHLGQKDEFNPEIRKDPYKNIDASLAYMDDLKKKYNGDPRLMAVGYNQGETYLDKHLKENNGKLNPAALKSEPKNYLQQTVEKLIPSAQAGAIDDSVPKPLTEKQEAGLKALPAAAPRGEYGMLQSIKDAYANAPSWQDVGRNVSNTLNALGGWTAPAATVSRAAGAASRELAPTAEAISEAARLKQIAETPRLLPPAKAGITALDEASQATRAAADAAKQSRYLAQDVEAARKAEQGVKAAELTSKAARTTEEALVAQQNARAIESAKLANVGKAHAALGGIEDLMGGPDAAAAPVAATPTTGAGETLPADVPGSIKDVAKETTTGKPSGFTNDMMLMLGLGLMGGQSPNALANLSSAGIGALKFGQEAKKEESEQAYKKALAEHYGVPSEVQMLEYLKNPVNMAAYQRQREAIGGPALMKELVADYLKNPAGMAILKQENPALYAAVRQQAMSAVAPQPLSALPGAGSLMRPPV